MTARQKPPAAGKGRPKGSLNKSTLEVKAEARKHMPAALKELARIVKEGSTDQARVAAIKELLDRGYGKAPQPMVGDDDSPDMKLTVRWQT